MPGSAAEHGQGAGPAGAAPGSWHVGEAVTALGEQCKSRTNADRQEDPKFHVELGSRLDVSAGAAEEGCR